MTAVESGKKSGVGIFKILGIITFVGVFIAVARIVIRVFREESRPPEEPNSGV
jgi:hypothetical protein